MTAVGIFQILFYLVTLIILVKPVGWYMACVYENKPCGLNQFFRPIENLLYRLCGIDPTQEMGWKRYLSAILILNFLGIVVLYIIQRAQGYLPFNPQNFVGVPPAISFNTAISFDTNTNWQNYAGESTLSYFTQMAGLTVQNFLSAASGMSILIALIRGITRHESNNLGNFWADAIRGILYILLPLAFVFALVLSSQGVIQNFKPYQKINLVEPISYQLPSTDNPEKTEAVISTEQVIPMGPVASQVAIKQLGTNGGGFFSTNSAHPFENPNGITNFLELLAILLIPASFCYTFGIMVKDKKQGWAIFLAMLIMFIPLMLLTVNAEQAGNPALTKLGIDQIAVRGMLPGGNMEGKEMRFGITTSALWAAATTATSNGSVNAMLDSFTPTGGLAPLWLMHLGEVIFGGVGSGLSGMLMLVIITVFVSGLMVGRTPEYLGKKIEPFEMKMASLAVLLMPMIVLLLTALGTATKMGASSISNPGPHGFTEILYAFTSMGNNNGSAFAGLNTNTPFFNIVGGLEMLFVRYWIAIPMLAIAGSLARKKIIPRTSGTLQTHTPLFIILLIGVIIILGALTFFPALALGPTVEQLNLWENYGH